MWKKKCNFDNLKQRLGISVGFENLLDEFLDERYMTLYSQSILVCRSQINLVNIKQKH